MRILCSFGMLLLLLSNWGCTKKIEGDVTNLQAQLEAVNLELASMKTSRADLDLIKITILSFNVRPMTPNILN